MCTNSEDIALHFTLSREQIEAMNHELIAWKNDLKVSKITFSCTNSNGDLQIVNMLGNVIKYKRYVNTLL